VIDWLIDWLAYDDIWCVALSGSVEAVRSQLQQLTLLVNQLRDDVARRLPDTRRN